jgi:hypothetical protein
VDPPDDTIVLVVLTLFTEEGDWNAHLPILRGSAALWDGQEFGHDICGPYAPDLSSVDEILTNLTAYNGTRLTTVQLGGTVYPVERCAPGGDGCTVGGECMPIAEDAGGGGSDAGFSDLGDLGDGGSNAGGDASDADGADSGDGGGCRTAAGNPPMSGGPLALAIAALLLRHPRARRARRPSKTPSKVERRGHYARFRATVAPAECR